MNQIEIFSGNDNTSVQKAANNFMAKLGKDNLKSVEVSTCALPPVNNSTIVEVRTTIVVHYVKNV